MQSIPRAMEAVTLLGTGTSLHPTSLHFPHDVLYHLPASLIAVVLSNKALGKKFLVVYICQQHLTYNKLFHPDFKGGVIMNMMWCSLSKCIS